MFCGTPPMRSKHLAAEAADAELQALQVGQRLDFLAEPAAHLGAGVAHREVDDVVLGVELAHQLQAVAFDIQASSGGCSGRRGWRSPARRSRPCRRSSTARCGHLDGAVLHGVDHAEGGHEFAAACTEIWNLPPVISRPSWRRPRRRRRWCPATSGSWRPGASGCWPGRAPPVRHPRPARRPGRRRRTKERRSMNISCQGGRNENAARKSARKPHSQGIPAPARQTAARVLRQLRR
jgi:hypothetical protein